MYTVEDVQMLAMAKHGKLIKEFSRNDSPEIILGSGHKTPAMYRLRIIFYNGLGLSVIQGEYASADAGRFEMATLDRKGEIAHGLNLVEDPSDSIVSNCDINKVMSYIERIGNY